MKTPGKIKKRLLKAQDELLKNLKKLVIKLLEKENEDVFILNIYDISPPIHKHSVDDNLTEIIFGIEVKNDELCFLIESSVADYSCDTEDVSVENLLYIYEEAFSVY